MEFDKEELINLVFDALKNNNLPTEIFEENINGLEFKKFEEINLTELRNKNINASYIDEYNMIVYNVNNSHLQRTLKHELLHVASTKRNVFPLNSKDLEPVYFHNIAFFSNTGISTRTYGNIKIGASINEGLTEFIREDLIPEQHEKLLLHPAYTRMNLFVPIFIVLIGREKIYNLYFKSDFIGFLEEMYRIFGKKYLDVILACDNYFNICLDKYGKGKLSNKLITYFEKKMNLTMLEALYSNNKNGYYYDEMIYDFYDLCYKNEPEEREYIDKKIKKISYKYNK